MRAQKATPKALDPTIALLLLAGPGAIRGIPRAIEPEIRKLWASGAAGLAAAWNQHEGELRQMAAARRIRPPWSGKFFGEAFAAAERRTE